MSVTRDDVARLAGVSAATVSYVVNNGPRPVSEDTRQRVLQAIELLGYHPSAVARSLKTKKTTTIGIIVSDILNPFLSAVAKAIEDAILPRNYSMILCNSDEDPEREHLFLNMLLAKQVDGIIMLPTCENKSFLFSLVEQRRIPIVLLDRQIEGLNVDCLLFDNFSGAYQATQHLIQQGHRRIAFFSLPRRLTPGHERAQGYDQALREAGLSYDPNLVVEGGFKAQEADDLAKKIFGLPDPPTALMVSSNRLLTGVLRYAKEHKLCIPDNFALAVFDDIPHYAYFTPSITAVRVDADGYGRMAATLLEEQIHDEGPRTPRTIRFPVELVIRESSTQLLTNCT
jgi:DNA-binding LacI/PurR family transcriptional regulator